MPADWYQFELQFPPEGLVDVVVQFAFADEGVLWLRLPVLARNHFLAHFRLESALRAPHPDRDRLRPADRARRFAASSGSGWAASWRRRRGAASISSAATASAWWRRRLNYLWRLTRPGSIAISRGSAAQTGEAPYDTWIRIFDEAPERDRARHAERLATLSRRPLISILAVVARRSLGARSAGARRGGTDLSRMGADRRGGAARRAGRGAGGARRRCAPSSRLVHAAADSAESLNAMLAVAQGEYVLPLGMARCCGRTRCSSWP